MAKKKSSTSRKRTPAKDLSPSAARSQKVKGGALLLSTQQLQASRLRTEGDGQPPERLGR